MTRMLAVIAALALLGCGSESDTSQPGGGGGSGRAAGAVLRDCKYVCGGTTGSYADSRCASGQAGYTSCGGPSKRQCTSPSDCLTCYNVAWVCE